MTSLLITGGSGFVGWNLAGYFATQMDITIAGRAAQPTRAISSEADYIRMDVSNEASVKLAVDKVQPQIVIHAAGNKDIRDCEDHPDLAHKINALGTRNVARACHRAGAFMVYLSTDMVFAGDTGNYSEMDTPRPKLVYGKTKLQGEQLAAAELNALAICRTSGVFGKTSPLLTWLDGRLRAGLATEAYTDIFNSPTYADNLAGMIACIIMQRRAGVFHTAGAERANRLTFFKAYTEAFGLDISLLRQSEFGSHSDGLLLHDSSLSVERSEAALGVHFNSVRESMLRFRKSGGL
jgi:dTDP-4-dehydrorhamnose reductase